MVSKVRGRFSDFSADIVTAENPLESTRHRDRADGVDRHRRRGPRRPPAHQRLLRHRAAPDDDVHVDRHHRLRLRLRAHRRPDDQGRHQAGDVRPRVRRRRQGPVGQHQGRVHADRHDQPQGLRHGVQRRARDRRGAWSARRSRSRSTSRPRSRRADRCDVTGLNHAVLWVRDARASAAFYQEALGFTVVDGDAAGRAVFLRAGGSANHHDLGLFTVGERPAPPPHAPGLYHLAWQVDDDRGPRRGGRRAARARRRSSAPPTTASSKSLYAKDPDGIEFEVMWLVPSDRWARARRPRRPRALDLAAELARWAASRRPDGPTSVRSGPIGPDHADGRSARRGRRAAPARASGSGTRSRRPQHLRAAPAGPRRAGRRRARRRAAASGRTPAPAARSGGAARRRSCRRARRCGPACGAVRFTGPDTCSSSRWTIAPTSSSSAIQLIHCRPDAEAAAEADLEQRQHLGQRPALRAPARCRCAGARPAARRARRPAPCSPPTPRRPRRGTRRPAATLVELLVAAIAVEPDRRARQQHPRDRRRAAAIVSASSVVRAGPRLEHRALVLVASSACRRCRRRRG